LGNIFLCLINYSVYKIIEINVTSTDTVSHSAHILSLGTARWCE